MLNDFISFPENIVHYCGGINTLEITGDSLLLQKLAKNVQGCSLSWDAAKWFVSGDDELLALYYKKPFDAIKYYINKKMKNNEIVYLDKYVDCERGSSIYYNKLSFHSICPIPFSIFAKGYSDEGRRWKLRNWGTGNDVARSTCSWDNENRLIYTFETTHNVPILLLMRLHEQYNDLMFTLSIKGASYTVLFAKNSRQENTVELIHAYHKDGGQSPRKYKLQLEPKWCPSF